MSHIENIGPYTNAVYRLPKPYIILLRGSYGFLVLPNSLLSRVLHGELPPLHEVICFVGRVGRGFAILPYRRRLLP